MAITITKPTVGASQDTWGTTINTALDALVDAVNGNAGLTAPNVEEGVWKISGTVVQSSGAELNLLDGALSNTVVNSKAVIYGSAGEVQATTVDLGNWTITENSGTLEFSYGGSVRFKMTSTGTFQADDDIQAVAF